ncbi:MAG TPA: hypothetical protein VLF21_01955 [Candidatus Saccharimonadales bacterium]|nr:hypothetical protein [Candidatus Saccharimonadales bacterium]
MSAKAHSESALLTSLVDQYQLEVDGVKFWTPYFINSQTSDTVKRPNMPAPYLGKGTPEQIKFALAEALKNENAHFSTGEEYRTFMHDQLIGVECSGFAYYVYDELLKATRGTELANHLFWSREELLDAFDKGIPWHRPELARSTVEAYPNVISLADVCKDWGWKEPRRMVRGDRYWQPAGVIDLYGFSDLRSGDMITMREKGSEIGHLVIVVEINGARITYAHSSRIKSTDNGGVHYGSFEVTVPESSVEKQKWEETEFLKTHYRYRLQRLKVLGAR